jgi:hypothetical protein
MLIYHKKVKSVPFSKDSLNKRRSFAQSESGQDFPAKKLKVRPFHRTKKYVLQLRNGLAYKLSDHISYH